MTNKPKKLIYAILVLAVVALVGWALLPQPLKVETAKVTAGPLHVTVDEEGQTRARDRYLIVAPADGRVARIALRDGDPIALDQPVAQLWPVPLSARERDEQLARIAAAEASLHAARSGLQRAEADARQKQRERARDEDLVKKNFVSAQVTEQSRAAATIAASDADAARARVRAAEADLRAAQAALLAIDEGAKGGSVTIRSPVAGRVLRIPERSERVVEAGTTLMTVGDPSKLEVVVDVLSQDAVKVRPGMPVLLVGWGEAKALDARVRRVEPYGFTKVSALGVEEQRVNIVADFVGGSGTLGDGYRVDARIVVWSADKVLKVPVSALFREGDKWAVFVVQGERARHRPVEVGRRNGEEAQITRGLQEGETIVRHPPNTLKDGARVDLTGAG